MWARSWTVALLALVACASGRDDAAIDAADEVDARLDAAVADAPADDGTPAIDAPAVDARIDAPAIDAPAIDAPIDGPPPVVATLLLTELVLAPNGGELIELMNPTGAAIDLSSYYLSDAPSYFRLPAGVTAVAADATDFVAKFPAGATIAAHSVVTVALDTVANFTIAYPTLTPTYSIASGTMTLLTAGTGPTLTNAGEPVVLFFWDGASDKAVDVDIMIGGSPTGMNPLVNKSGVAIDGPDADTTPGTYAADANTVPTQTAPASARSTKRIALESPAVETQTGAGNGVLGHDETSEQTNLTWDGAAYTAPTPGTVPAAIGP